MSDACRRPITDEERPHLQALGAALKETRQDSGLTSVEIARAAGITPNFLWRLENGLRRTRRSTLDRLALALADYLWQTAPEDLTAEWLDLAGPALAPESAYAHRVEQRREKRTARNIRRAQRQAESQERQAQRDYEAIRQVWYERACERVARNNAATVEANPHRTVNLQAMPTREQYGLTPRP